jgi:predicted dehydrogenase
VKNLTASIVGGGTGGRVCLAALTASPYFEPVALTDLRPEVCRTLQEAYPTLQTFTDFREMLRRRPTDIVCVSTYPPSHEEVALEALKLPLKAILVEKPLAHNVSSARRILESVKSRNLPLATPHGLLVKRCPLEIIERVQAGAIGPLRLVEIQSPGWDMMSAGIHWLHFSIILNGLQPVDSVLAACDKSTRTFRDGMQVETVAITSVQMANGVRILMHTGDTVRSNGRRDAVTFRIVGAAGQIEFWGWEPDYFLVDAQHPEGKLIRPEEELTSLHQRHLENFLPMIASGKSNYLIPDTSLSALEICEAAYLSARHGVEVKFPLERFVLPLPNDWQPGHPYVGQTGGRDGRKPS